MKKIELSKEQKTQIIEKYNYTKKQEEDLSLFCDNSNGTCCGERTFVVHIDNLDAVLDTALIAAKFFVEEKNKYIIKYIKKIEIENIDELVKKENPDCIVCDFDSFKILYKKTYVDKLKLIGHMDGVGFISKKRISIIDEIDIDVDIVFDDKNKYEVKYITSYAIIINDFN